MIIGIATWLVLGLIAGFIASSVLYRHHEGLVMDLVLGACGALLGGFLFRAFGADGMTGFNLWSLLVACVGSFGVLGIWHVALPRRARL